MANKIKNYYSRKFLNKKQGVAAVETVFESWDSVSGFDSTVSISDCSRSIRLDFSVYSCNDLAASYAKLQLLIDELSNLHEHITVNYEDIATKLKEGEEERKKRLKNRKKQSFEELVDGINDEK